MKRIIVKTRRPVKFDWLLIDKSYCPYMQWALYLQPHFLDFWEQ
jgi:hypothetical protein